MELKPIELENNLGPDANGVVHHVPWVAYDKDEVDQLIAEKDKEIAQLKADLADLWDDKRDTDKLLDERNAEIARLKQELTDITSVSALNCEAIRRLHIDMKTEHEKYNEEIRELNYKLWADKADNAARMKRLIHDGEIIYLDEYCNEMDWRIMYKVWEDDETRCCAMAEKFNSRR